MSEQKKPRKLNTGSATHSGSGSAGRKINRSTASGSARSSQQAYHAPAASKAAQPKKKKGCLVPALVTLLCLALVVALGLAIVYKTVVHSISPEGGNPTINEIINTPGEFKGDVVNILVCGVDYEEGRVYSDAESNDGLTDMIMYVNFDVANRKINMFQIPRDTYAGEDYSTGGTGKINQIALKNGGVPALMELIHDQYKLPVDYYVSIDMQSMKEIIDLFGGIEVYVPRDMEYKGSVLKAGLQTMDGNAAEFFVRNRHGSGYAQGDIARLDMQRYFYQGLFKRIRTATVWDLAKLTPVALKYVETNIPMDELISIGVSFLKVDSADIMMCKMPTYSAAEKYNGAHALQVCDPAKTTDLLNQYFRTYGGPVNDLNIPLLPVAGASSDANVQYMGQLDTQTDGEVALENQ